MGDRAARGGNGFKPATIVRGHSGLRYGHIAELAKVIVLDASFHHND